MKKQNPTAAMTTTVLETSGVAPPPGAVAEQSLPLTFFDINWLHFHPMLQLLFYEIPSLSKPHFLEKIVPNLKKSLSLTLQHFFPLSGHVVFPSSPAEMPVYRYRAGDEIPLAVAESSDDFDDLVAKKRNQSADQLYDFIPNLPEIVEESDCKLLKLLAVQVTLFPGRGVCVGITTHHCASDAPSFLAFLTSWAATSKLGSDQSAAGSESPPVFDRSLINYPQKLDSIYWERARKTPPQPRRPSLPTNRLRSTYIFTESEIKHLKNSIQSEKIPNPPRISSFVAIGAHIWSTMAKSLRSDAESDAFFLIPIDLRARLEPAVPASYFGNCLSFALPRIGRRELAGEGGASLAAAAMAAAIEARAGDRKILEGVEEWAGEIRAAVQKSFFSVAGSTRLDLYGADFGWGKAKKQEILSIDGERYAMTLCKARDFEGGFEVCLSLPKEEMEAFDACFAKGIN